MQPSPDPVAVPLGEAPVDRGPGRPEHRRQLPPGATRGGYEGDRGECLPIGPPSAGPRPADASPQPAAQPADRGRDEDRGQGGYAGRYGSSPNPGPGTLPAPDTAKFLGLKKDTGLYSKIPGGARNAG